MSFLPIYRTLNSDSAVKALLGNDLRVYEEIAPLNTAVPYAVWQEVGGSAENSLDCPAKTDHVMYQVIVYDTNQKRAYEARNTKLYLKSANKQLRNRHKAFCSWI